MHNFLNLAPLPKAILFAVSAALLVAGALILAAT